MKNTLLFLSLLSSTLLFAQTTLEEQVHSRLIDLHQVAAYNKNFEGFDQIKKEIGDAEIVMLGEQSHGEATTFETKIKLIKYLHEEMGFEVVAFETSFYAGHKAWSMIQEGHDVRDALGKSIFPLWSAIEEFKPFVTYMEQRLQEKQQLMIAGFDNQLLQKLDADHLVKELTAYINTFQDVAVYQNQLADLETFFSYARHNKIKKFKKKKALASITFLEELETVISTHHSDESAFWLQTIKNLSLLIADLKLGTEHRDRQMANNLVWLKEKYPNKKIICWGATSHFLYNSSQIRMKSKALQILANHYKKHDMMGNYIKEKYGDKVYTIGFTAYEGQYGETPPRTIDAPLKNSVEYLIGTAAHNNYFLPLKGLSLDGYLSRPLGNFYMTTPINKVMDGVIFNRKMRGPNTDWDFYMYLFPENKYIPRKIDRLKAGPESAKDKASVPVGKRT